MRTGVWLIGARGSVATTVLVGAAALRAGLSAPTGCVTVLSEFAAAGLPGIPELVFGGHDVTSERLLKRAEQLAEHGVFPLALPALVAAELAAADERIRPGVASNDPRPEREQVAGLVADLEAFRSELDLARVVVVNVATTEPISAPDPAHESLDALVAALDEGRPVLPASSRYAYAALLAGCGYVDFTPSSGARLRALHEQSIRSGVPFAGSDGKTGETLVKSVLAPMFVQRALRVRAWSGVNLLGGGDGAALEDPLRGQAKRVSKRRVTEESLGYEVDGDVHIHHVSQLGDWKTAWDHIVFEGFLGTSMTMQFTWHGCDSALAAPLVLDLARFVARAHEVGIHGPLPALAFFFKDPVGEAPAGLAEQYNALGEWARTKLAAP
jgi:myo-inositol-1-phosphate synthase